MNMNNDNPQDCSPCDYITLVECNSDSSDCLAFTEKIEDPSHNILHQVYGGPLVNPIDILKIVI